jgi:inhibitor of cysteine peptidase
MTNQLGLENKHSTIEHLELIKEFNVICINYIRKERIMLRGIFSIIALVVALAPMVGCASKQVKLTGIDTGKTVDVKVGEMILVELEGNPSTGYTWEVKDLDASFLQQVGEIAFNSGNPGLIGSGGTLTLTYKTLKAGTTTLNLVYHRPWEKDIKPLNTFLVTINIQ